MKQLILDGETYRLADPTDGRIQQELIRLIKAADTDPVKEAAALCKDLPPEVQTALLKDAMARKYDAPAMSREERQQRQQAKLEAYVSSAEGMEAFLLLLWRRHQPTLSPDQVWLLHGKAVAQHGEEYFECGASESNKS